MEKGAPIEVPNELVFVHIIKIDNVEYEVFFRNKTLKHFIERRKEDLSKRHTQDESLDLILKMINDLYEVLGDYTSCILNKDRENSYVVSKHFSDVKKTGLTAVLVKEGERQIIISFFFTKR